MVPASSPGSRTWAGLGLAGLALAGLGLAVFGLGAAALGPGSTAQGLGASTPGSGVAVSATARASLETAAGALPTTAQSGEQLVLEHRCGACHVDLPPPAAPVALPNVSALRVLEVLRPGVAGSQPEPTDAQSDATDTRGAAATQPAALSTHPDFRLSTGEALAVALALGTGAAEAGARRELGRLGRSHPDATPELGRRLASGLNCGGCHAGMPASAAAGPTLIPLVAGTRTEWLRTYLRAPHAIRPFGTRPGSGARMPDFALADAAIDSVAAYLQARAAAAGAATRAAGQGDVPAHATEAVPGPAAQLTRHQAATADAMLDRLACRGCHVYDGRGGRIGPDLDHVRMRRTGVHIAGMIRDPGGTLPGAAMPRPTDTRLDGIIALLTGGDPRRGDPSAAPPVNSTYLSPLDHDLLAVADDATAASYALWCAACHGASGDGDGYNARYLRGEPVAHADASVMSTRADATLHDAIAAGGAAMGRSPEMPAYGATLDAARVRGLVAYLRRLCACTQPAWARQEGG